MAISGDVILIGARGRLSVSGCTSPVVIANHFGKEGQVGASAFFGSPMEDPERVDAILAFPGTLPVGTVLTFQGAILDPTSPSPKGASVANGVVAIFEYGDDFAP